MPHGLAGQTGASTGGRSFTCDEQGSTKSQMVSGGRPDDVSGVRRLRTRPAPIREPRAGHGAGVVSAAFKIRLAFLDEGQDTFLEIPTLARLPLKTRFNFELFPVGAGIG